MPLLYVENSALKLGTSLGISVSVGSPLTPNNFKHIYSQPQLTLHSVNFKHRSVIITVQIYQIKNLRSHLSELLEQRLLSIIYYVTIIMKVTNVTFDCDCTQHLLRFFFYDLKFGTTILPKNTFN